MGDWVVVRPGDMIETEQLKKFVYDQGDSPCSIDNLGQCNDEFSYIPYGKWTGYGEY
jgi:hypothetical protein